ncbi:BamA/TamA family outer membrane protein [Flavobacterium ardleyense]|uniref:BamA/TamA family outer membrane protein n=1 Tax=Flavobacterium ardleyense TaxID=2038737 RepID=A0ABW5Z460_9FLAO
MKYYKLLILLIILATISSCTGLKAVPEGDYLYTGAKVKIEDKDISKRERNDVKDQIKELLIPKPNKSILGLRPALFFYNLAGDVKKEKGFRYWLKYKLGQEPVLFSKVDMDYNSDITQNYVENIGYFNATTVADSSSHGRTAKAKYNVTLRKQYIIKSITLPADSTVLSNEINKSMRRTLLKVGKPYNLQNIKDERSRIDVRLKEKGFFYFDENYLLFQVDSTVANHEVDLILKIKNEIPAVAQKQYRINDIIIYSNFTLNDTVSKNRDSAFVYNDFKIYDREKMFKPKIYDRTLYFHKDDLYNRTNHNLSLNRLVTLGTFKFVKNQFTVVEGKDGYLDATYYLTPLPRKSIRFEVLAKTNSANYNGTEINTNWSNRNAFRGAELLTLGTFVGIETQFSGQNKGFNVYRFGGEATLIWPRFIVPFKLRSASGFVPRTKLNLFYENQVRTKLYHLNTFKGSFGYLWKESERKEHELKLTEITYVNSTSVSNLYKDEIIENPSLGKVIEEQLIFGPSYSYTFTNTMQKRKKHTFYFKGSLDFSGNLAGLVMGATSSVDPKEIAGVAFSQFTKAEADFRHYLNLGGELQVASRAIVGVGYAYGNSRELPYIKQFFIGGTNSVRAFRARSIGPGVFDESALNNTFLPDQSGDIKVEFNTELRGKIYNFIKGAVFVDAGNIWLLNEDSNKPGGQISSKFLEQLAIGTGVGLRFDFSFLVLRTDLAFPLKYPTSAEFNNIDPLDKRWRKDNLMFNLAIGYPF